METQVTNQEDNINHSPEPSMDDILESDDEPYTTGPVPWSEITSILAFSIFRR